jgi:DNA-binding NarL/FixJ family response regulator
MKLRILIAEPQDILRAGLRTILFEDERIEHIDEAATKEDLQLCLRYDSFDLMIINQLFISEEVSLPSGRFVVLAPELDMTMFRAMYKQKARGYFLENVSAELLRATLSLSEEAFLIEPTLTSPIIDHLLCDTRFLIKDELLTPREREILSLLRSGMDRPLIADHLSISEATLKTHLKNIARKRKQEESSANDLNS